MQMGDSRLQYVVTVALLYMTVCVSDSTCDLLKCYCTRGGVVPCLADNTCEINTAGTVEGGSIIHQRCRAFLDLETNTIQYDCVKFGGKSLFSGSSTCSNKQKINIVSCCFNETLCNRYLPLSSIPSKDRPMIFFLQHNSSFLSHYTGIEHVELKVCRTSINSINIQFTTSGEILSMFAENVGPSRL